MAITVTTDLVDITNADTLTASGTFYRLGGASSSNPAADGDAFVQGTACVAWKTSSTVSPTDTGGHFNHTSTFDLTNKHIFSWRMVVTAGNMTTTANQGLVLGLTNTSTTSNTTWSTTNYKKWYLDGSDKQPNSSGWVCYVVDPSSAGNISAGTLTLSTVKNIGLIIRQNSTVTSTLNNTFADAIRAGSGVTATASSSGDTINLNSIYSVDSTKTNSWGILTQVAGIYYGAGKINIGSTGQTNACNFTDTDQVFIWRDFPVADTLYGFNLLGASGQKTSVTFNSSVLRGQAGQVWNITCDANSDFKAYNCTLSNLRAATLSSGSVLNSNTVDVSGTIDVNGATITGCEFTNHTLGTQLKVDSTSDISNVSDCSFTSSGTGGGHAIEITSPGSYTFTSLSFSNYAGTLGTNSTANSGSTDAAVYNNSGGAVTITVNGGSNLSIRNGASATTTVITGQVALQLTGLVSGSDIVILNAGTTTERINVDAHGSTTYTYNYTYNAGEYVDICIYKSGYIPFTQRGYLLSDTNGSLPIKQVADRNYYNPA